MDCGIVSIGQLFGPDLILTYNAFRTRVPNARADFLLYEGVSSAIRGYQRKLGLGVKENFVVGDSWVWKCIGQGNVKDTYACPVANGDTPKCVDRWSKTLDIVIDTKDFFVKIFKTTNDTCFRWFQYKMLYRLISTGRFRFQRKLVDSP